MSDYQDPRVLLQRLTEKLDAAISRLDREIQLTDRRLYALESKVADLQSARPFDPTSLRIAVESFTGKTPYERALEAEPPLQDTP